MHDLLTITAFVLTLIVPCMVISRVAAVETF